MSCSNKITKNIVSDCSTNINGGLETKVWIFNRTDVTITFSNSKITDLTNKATKKCYTATGIKKLFNAGHDIVVSDNRPNKFTHHFMLSQFELTAADIENLDGMEDLFIVVESKDKTSTGEGTFIGYGAKNGLYTVTDTRRWNDNNGVRNVEFASMAGQEEPYSHYVVFDTNYATTLAMLEDCEGVPA